ncbi:MAG: TonB-dependent receptor [Candidatus Endonucleobacter bathymodioli]|uniref:TonB-dependent receptor n=1 Tax=Candidatus Endonucleibacter bathymodioli TaxID=539814 RepID=A0AA90NMH9_9GAMM|nr:TonB-dependent receptor [Candidatus Endonucleobacter bathymodioli]
MITILSCSTLAQAVNIYRFDEVIVTAPSTTQMSDESLASVTVISRKDIECSQATSVTELLINVPGIQISRYGGPGSLTSALIRGASACQTLVIVDGQRLNSATSGIPEFQYLQPDQIDRIEVVRGSKSSLYGADAIGGVIQIFTRKGIGKSQLTVKTSMGSLHTCEQGINYSGRNNSIHYNLGANLYETAGYDVTNDNYPVNLGVNLDNKAYRNKFITGKASCRLKSDTDIEVSFYNQTGKTEYGGYTIDPNNFIKTYPYSAYTLFERSALNISSVIPVNTIWLSRIDAGYLKDQNKQLGKNYHPSAPHIPSFYETKRISSLWQNDIAWGSNQQLTTGIDYYRDIVASSNTYNNPKTGDQKNSRYNAAIFIQNQTQLNLSTIQFGLRRDKNESYGFQTTGNITWMVHLPKDLRLAASYSTAYRPPSFNELYYPDSTFSSGNSNLKPENSKTRELELKGLYSHGKWSLSLFQNTIDDLINWTADTSGKFKPTNVDKARIYGLETSMSTIFKQWRITISGTLLDPKDTTRNTVLQRRAKQYMVANVDYNVNKLCWGGSFRAQGRCYDDANNNVRLAGFAIIDMRVSYKIHKEFTTQLKIINLFDKKYQTAWGYNGEPKGFFITLIWQPVI